MTTTETPLDLLFQIAARKNGLVQVKGLFLSTVHSFYKNDKRDFIETLVNEHLDNPDPTKCAIAQLARLIFMKEKVEYKELVNYLDGSKKIADEVIQYAIEVIYTNKKYLDRVRRDNFILYQTIISVKTVLGAEVAKAESNTTEEMALRN